MHDSSTATLCQDTGHAVHQSLTLLLVESFERFHLCMRRGLQAAIKSSTQMKPIPDFLQQHVPKAVHAPNKKPALLFPFGTSADRAYHLQVSAKELCSAQKTLEASIGVPRRDILTQRINFDDQQGPWQASEKCRL